MTLLSQPPWRNFLATQSTNLTLSNSLHSPLMLKLCRTRYYSTYPTGVFAFRFLVFVFLAVMIVYTLINTVLFLDWRACSFFWLTCSISDQSLVHWQGCFGSQVRESSSIFLFNFITMAGLYILVCGIVEKNHVDVTLHKCRKEVQVFFFLLFF